MDVKLLNSLEKIQALKKDWDHLYERTRPGLFLHHSWVYNNYRLLEKGSIVLIAVHADRGTLIGIFPFAVRPLRIRWMTFNALVHGGSVATDYSLFMVDPGANRRLMIRRVLKKLEEIQPRLWDFICIENLSNGVELSNIFINLATRHFYTGTIAAEITPVIDFGNPYSEAKKISNIRRRFRKIHEECSISHLRGTKITNELMQRFSRLHKVSFPDAGFDRPDAQKFFRTLIEDGDFNEHVSLSMIEHGDKMVAAHFGFEDDETFYYYVPTYNEEYATYGPGQYLLWELITDAEKKGRRVFDLLRGGEDYKFNWTNNISTNHTLFGTVETASFFRRLLVNLWILTKSMPCFTRR